MNKSKRDRLYSQEKNSLLYPYQAKSGETKELQKLYDFWQESLIAKPDLDYPDRCELLKKFAKNWYNKRARRIWIRTFLVITLPSSLILTPLLFNWDSTGVPLTGLISLFLILFVVASIPSVIIAGFVSSAFSDWLFGLINNQNMPEITRKLGYPVESIYPAPNKTMSLPTPGKYRIR